MTDQITPKQFHEAEGVADWRVVGDGACACFRAGSLAGGARLVQAISELPGVEDHSPDVDVRGDGLTVRLITYTDDYYGSEFAPSWWTLADAAGNEADIATAKGRN